MTFDLGTGASAAFSRNRYDTASTTLRNADADFKIHYRCLACAQQMNVDSLKIRTQLRTFDCSLLKQKNSRLYKRYGYFNPFTTKSMYVCMYVRIYACMYICMYVVRCQIWNNRVLVVLRFMFCILHTYPQLQFYTLQQYVLYSFLFSCTRVTL